MKPRVQVRFWLEAGLGLLCGFLAVLTVFWRAWIEALTGVDPDHHNGVFEWAIVGGLLAGVQPLGTLGTWFVNESTVKKQRFCSAPPARESAQLMPVPLSTG